ncbi:beta-ketoacyl-ACP synthase 3 [Pseudomonas aeruginosa]
MPRAAVVCGLGSYLPEAVLSNDMLAAELDTSDAWISSRTGVRQRHIAGDLGSGDLALRAASAALASAGLERVDAVVLATSTGDFCCPATAPRVAARLGLVGALAFDLSAACTGFVYGLASVGSLISAGLADSALLVGVDTFSHTLDPADRSTRALFGDGAGAVVLRAGDAEEEGALLAFDLGSDGHQFDLLMTPAVSRAERSSGQASNYFRMDGKAVFGQAVTQMSDSVRRVLDRVGWQASDLHHLVPHQANTRILAAVADQLDLPVERVVSNIAEVGNTVAASIPLALAHGLRQGILRDGGNMVLTGFGAGLTWVRSPCAGRRSFRQWTEEGRTMPNDMEDHLLTVLSVASGVPKEEISRDSRMEDLAFDSLVVSELSLKLRKEFGVTGVDDELDLLETVDELFQLVEKHRAA